MRACVFNLKPSPLRFVPKKCRINMIRSPTPTPTPQRVLDSVGTWTVVTPARKCKIIADSHRFCGHMADLFPPIWLPFTRLVALPSSLVHMEHCRCTPVNRGRMHGPY